MKKNKIEKYLTQKRISIIDILSYAVIGIGTIMVSVVNNGGPMGFPIILIGLIILNIARTSKVSDAIFDKKLNEILEKHNLIIDDNTIASYDFEKSMVKGLDKKMRSRYYCILKPYFGNDALQLDMFYVDVLLEAVAKKQYEIVGSQHPITINETMLRTSDGYVKLCTLNCNLFETPIPISTNDINTSNLIDKICSYEKN